MVFSTLKTLAGVVSLALLAGSAQAETFTLFIYEAPSQFALRNDRSDAGKAYWAGYNQFAASLMQAGALRGGTALDATDVTTLDQSGWHKGTYLDGNKILGGYFIIETDDLAAAQTLAGQAPAVLTGSIQIHRTAPNPTQNADMTGAY
ncbi:YciI family protein [Asticcacaulis sp. AC402]|uniref:YciI family protein n=1 Tax=Asticcacaulis sp. AC402 TaxID=1282361 RepID=UPI0003C3F955|nr:YciI family protein [Asticcacaulis sp. AC402]ESQ75637.1 hypothetical protein ABAC402_08920 [Asticcacaulis sp. AC402]